MTADGWGAPEPSEGALGDSSGDDREASRLWREGATEGDPEGDPEGEVDKTTGFMATEEGKPQRGGHWRHPPTEEKDPPPGNPGQ